MAIFYRYFTTLGKQKKRMLSRLLTPGDIVNIEGVKQGERETSNVNLEEELIAFMTNKNNYEANLRTVKATEELQGTLFDILA